MALGPACSVRLYVGSGVPGNAGRYKGSPLAFDESVFRDLVEAAVKRKFKNATFFKTRGVWRGGSEDGYMVEVIMSPSRDSCVQIFQRAEKLAGEIATILGQEAVMLIATDARGGIEQGFITAAA